MKKLHLVCLAILALALLFAGLGWRAFQPTYAEQAMLDATERVSGEGHYSESLADTLEKVKMYATHVITSETEDLANQDTGMAAVDTLLQERLGELNSLNSMIEEKRLAMQRAGKSMESVPLIRKVLDDHISWRGTKYFIVAAVLAFCGLLPLFLSALNLERRTRERLIHSTFFATASVSIIVLFLIMLFLFIEGLPVFKHVPVMDFLFGDEWYPTEDPPSLQIFPLIVASGAVTLVSSLMSIPLGVMTAIYLAEIAPPKVRSIVKPTVEMLNALPSVVIGFFGMVVVAPFLQETFGLWTGLNLFNASLMLAFMAVPTITSISEDAIYSVPMELKEASLALGATHWQSIWKVVIPASLSGITTAVILGMARAIGETMVVLMVAGGAAMIPTSLFDPVRPMPASIAAEMAEAPFHSEHYYALFAIGMVLFLFTMAFNFVADIVSHRYKQVGASTL